MGRNRIFPAGGSLKKKRALILADENSFKTVPTAVAELKSTIADLKAQLAAATKELSEYKSVRGKLRTAELEQENEHLRSKIRSYENTIERNNLWSYFFRHRENATIREDFR